VEIKKIYSEMSGFTAVFVKNHSLENGKSSYESVSLGILPLASCNFSESF
jgi:hypothetical protein